MHTNIHLTTFLPLSDLVPKDGQKGACFKGHSSPSVLSNIQTHPEYTIKPQKLSYGV